MADNDKLDLGRFTDRFALMRRTLSQMPAGNDRWTAFCSLSTEVASWTTQGIERGMVIDAIYDLGTSYQCGTTEEIQIVLGDAIAAADAIERVPDDDEDPGSGLNGSTHPNAPRDARVPSNRKEKEEPLPPILTKQAFLDAFGRAPDYLIDDILQKGFLYSLTGLTGHFKTAIALLIAQLVASEDDGVTLGFHKVRKGRVIYFSGENPNDVSWRVMGSDDYRRKEVGEDPAKDNISFIAGGFDVDRMLDVLARDSKAHGAIALIVVDTSAVYFKGKDENDNVSAGNHARMLRKLTLLPGRPCVLVLSHPAKSVSDWTQLQPRGGGAFVNEVDGNLTCWKTTEKIAELNFLKLRGPTFQPIKFEIMDATCDELKDAEGRSMKTVRAQVVTAEREEAVLIRTTERTQQLLVAMMKRPVDLPAPEKGSYRKWAIDMGWVNEIGQPLHGQVARLIGDLLADEKKNRLVERNKYKQMVLTKAGLTEAQKIHAASEQLALAPPPAGNNAPDQWRRDGDGGLDG